MPNQGYESTTLFMGGNHVQGSNFVFNSYIGFQQVDKLLAYAATSALYDTAQIEDPAKCHPGTREAVLRRLRASLDTKTASKPFVWMHGAAGVGKSAIARTLCECLHTEGQQLLSFFFFHGSLERNNATRFIATLALQFQSIIPQLRGHIKQYIDDNPHIFTQSIDTQARRLLIDPICQLHTENALSSPPSIAIVVDGLDECHDTAHRRRVMDVLAKLKSTLPFPVTVLIASRPDRDIMKIFKLPPFEDETTEEPLNLERDADTDILKFYNDAFAKIEKFHPLSRHFTRVKGAWPAPAIIKTLIEKTSGQFIFAKTIIRFVEPDTSDPDKRLQIIIGVLPPLHYRPFAQLDAIYTHILSSIEPDRTQDVLNILGTFLCDYSSLPYKFTVIPQQQHINAPSIWTPKRDTGLIEWILDLKVGQCQQLLIGLEALLTFAPDDELQIFHKSFSDFLFDPLRSNEFHIAQDLIYERVLRSFIQHHFYDTACPPRMLMFTNMSFLFSKARITPELLSAIKSVDFVQLDALLRRSDLLLRVGEDSEWLHICQLFVDALLHSESHNVPDRNQLAEQLIASLKAVESSRGLVLHIDNPTLSPLLDIATHNQSPSSVHLIPPDLLHQGQADAFSMYSSRMRSESLCSQWLT